MGTKFFTPILAALAIGGCSSRGETMTPLDASPRDAAVSDTATSAVDGTSYDSAADSSALTDSSVDASAECRQPIDPIRWSDLPRCTNETRDALGACANDGACIERALMADPTPEVYYIDSTTETWGCSECFHYNVQYAWQQNGCSEQLNAARCCTAEHCPTQSDSCIASACGSEQAAFTSCVMNASEAQTRAAAAILNTCFGA